MGLDCAGFFKEVSGAEVSITVSDEHPLIKLATKIPWEDMLELILPDLRETDKFKWWVGRPLRIRVHLGLYILQQMYNLTDRQAEYALKDNVAFQLFCGKNILKHWHAPDHTKIETFRSRLKQETQRQLANLIAKTAVKHNYACPKDVDIDSTIQEANISPPSKPGLLIKVARLAQKVGKELQTLTADKSNKYHIRLGHLRKMFLHYYTLKRSRRQDNTHVCQKLLERLWQDISIMILPIVKDSYKLTQQRDCWFLRRSVEQLQWRAAQVLENMHSTLFMKENKTRYIHSLHAYEVTAFNKNKVNYKVQYGRAFQLARIEGNFAYVGPCTSLHLPDAQNLPVMVNEHQRLFGDSTITSITVDRGYYSHENKEFLKSKRIDEIYMPKRYYINDEIQKSILTREQEIHLHNRRSGIESIISHIKQGGQLRRSRMKSDNTTLAAGYASVLGFNLRQLKRYAAGVVQPKSEELTKFSTNSA